MQDLEREERYLPPSRKNIGERRVYQYATGRGGVPLDDQRFSDEESESRVYQYATGRGGVPLTRQDMERLKSVFKDELREEPRGEHFGKGPKGWKLSDDKIREDVCDALYRSYDVDASGITVEVKDCVVTLKGTVEDRQMKRLAEDAADDVTGVKDVQNHLVIKPKETH
jgi:osmotically-inducible protein OsmY